MIIKSLADSSIESIHRAFLAAFSDYSEPVEMSLERFLQTSGRRGLRVDLSFGAFEGDELAGFTLNAVGDWNGIRTAYDTGTGVRPEYRGQGIATQIFEVSLPVLRRHAVRRYLLEVIRTNTGAVKLYRQLGFRATREFDYWSDVPDIALGLDKRLPPGFSIDTIQSLDWQRLSRFWDFRPSWQNSTDSVERQREHFLVLGAFFEGRLLAYVCMERETGDVPQFAVHPEYRRRGLASVLLRELTERVRPPELRFTNTEAGSEPVRRFLLGIGLQPGDGQYEMMLNL